jgi:hypothetical protein
MNSFIILTASFYFILFVVVGDWFYRKRILRLLEKLQESLNLTGTLRTAVAKKHEVLALKCRSLRGELLPEQLVQLLGWITKYENQIAQVGNSSYCLRRPLI